MINLQCNRLGTDLAKIQIPADRLPYIRLIVFNRLSFKINQPPSISIRTVRFLAGAFKEENKYILFSKD